MQLIIYLHLDILIFIFMQRWAHMTYFIIRCENKHYKILSVDMQGYKVCKTCVSNMNKHDIWKCNTLTI